MPVYAVEKLIEGGELYQIRTRTLSDENKATTGTELQIYEASSPVVNKRDVLIHTKVFDKGIGSKEAENYAISFLRGNTKPS